MIASTLVHAVLYGAVSRLLRGLPLWVALVLVGGVAAWMWVRRARH